MHDSSSSPTTSATPIYLLDRLREDPSDAEAWCVLVDRYGPKIYAWCCQWGLQESDSRDATQNVLVKLFERMGRFRYDPERSFRAYLKTMTYYAWCDLVKVRDSREAGGVAALDSVAARDDLVRRLEEAHDLQMLSLAMDRVAGRVEPRTLEAFRLLAFEGLPGEEVGRRLGMKVSSVFVARCRVLKMLKDEVRAFDPP